MTLALSALLSLAAGAESEANRPLTLGYQLDAGRGKVPLEADLHRLVDLLAKLGYTQFQLYNESTFAYAAHPAMQDGRPTLSAAEMRALDDYCQARNIELVPNQNSFGHLESWFCKTNYLPLAEAPKGVHVKKPKVDAGPMSLCATDPRSREFLSGLYDELLPCFRSKWCNVGCDEVWDLRDANCRSAAEIARMGEGNVYLGHLLMVYDLLRTRGHGMMFWADMVFDHPELVPKLPQEGLLALDWGYEAKSPFEAHAAALEKCGVPFCVCPGTSAWGSLFGRVDNMKKNVSNAVKAMRRHGGRGLLLADWGDGGHPQPLLVSVPSLVYAAACLRGEELDDAALASAIDRLIGCTCGEALIRYGNLYLKCGAVRGNGTYLYDFWRFGREFKKPEALADANLRAVMEERRAAKAAFVSEGAPQWVKDDFELLDLLGTLVELRWRDEHDAVRHLAGSYRDLWLKHNKPGASNWWRTPFER